MCDPATTWAGVALLAASAPPCSFVYDGRPSSELLPSWRRTESAPQASGGRQVRRVTYTDPATGLEVTAEVTLFADFPAVEWVLRFRNTGAADTPIVNAILPLDLTVEAPPTGDVVLHHSHGSTSSATDFIPIDTPLAPGADLRLAPNGGRSSDGNLPFFNLEWSGGGLLGAIGWSGQWALRVRRDEGRAVSLQAGQETTHFRLHPGESIRTPRILLLRWDGEDRLRAHNLLRGLLLTHYVPRVRGEVVKPPVAQGTWFLLNTGNDVTEANQLEMMQVMKAIGVDTYWLDAGWFEGGWPEGAGSWAPKKRSFPRGLRPLGDAAHEKGMRFVLWFEPERVNPASRIAREHPEWVLQSGEGDGLFNLGDPAARQWLTDFLSERIEEWGVDIYRHDFNIDPLRFWRAADAPDRQGITEIRYLEGFYALWDDLLARHRGLVIDNCASGGRRLDLETLRRSVPLWRSDTPGAEHALPVQDQNQTAGLSLYVPLHASGVWSFDPYLFRSAATMGLHLCQDTRDRESWPQARRALAEVKSLQPLYLGDYYPLTAIRQDEEHWCGWQFDRPELGQGFAMLFRRAQSPQAALEANLRGVDPRATYEVTVAPTYETPPPRKMTGSELARLRVEIGSQPGSALIRYRKPAR